MVIMLEPTPPLGLLETMKILKVDVNELTPAEQLIHEYHEHPLIVVKDIHLEVLIEPTKQGERNLGLRPR